MNKTLVSRSRSQTFFGKSFNKTIAFGKNSVFLTSYLGHNGSPNPNASNDSDFDDNRNELLEFDPAKKRIFGKKTDKKAKM